MAVPFQTPTVPLATCISLVKTKDQRRDSYQPRERGDHSKYWIRMGEGSMPRIWAPWMVRRILVVGWSVGASVRGNKGPSCSIKVRMV